jgi:hypothetical protein
MSVPKEYTSTRFTLIKCSGMTGVADALATSEAAQLRVLFAPDVAAYRCAAVADASRRWHNWVLAPSLRAVGSTPTGAAVVVYAHVPHDYTDPPTLRALLARPEQQRRTFAPLPHDEFDRLLGLDGLTDDEGVRRVTVLDYDLRRTGRRVLSVDDAATDPDVLATLGSARLVQAYLTAHARAYRARTITTS